MTKAAKLKHSLWCVCVGVFRASGLHVLVIWHLCCKNTSNICWWSRVEVKCQKIRSDLATNLRWAGTIYISGLNYFDLEAWSCCDPAYQRRRNSLLNLNMDDIESWTLAQIQETKPNQRTPPRQMRNKTPARPRHRALTSQTSENNLSHRLFNVEHEYHFEVL